MDKKLLKQTLLDELYTPYIRCIMCPLGSLGRKNVVFGRGNPDAKLLILGEAPGKDEDLQGLPFVGRSGQLLAKTLALLGVDETMIYITNIVKCRPPENRPPTPKEVTTCTNLLLKNQLKIIQPTIICTLGASATKALLGSEFKITEIRGTIQKYGSIKVLPTFHPAYILRDLRKLPLFSQDLQAAISYINTNEE